MSTEQKTTQTPSVPLTDQEKLDRAVKGVVTVVTAQVKKSVQKSSNTPAILYGNRVGAGVEKIWQSGKIPSEEDLRKEGLKLAKGGLTPGALLSICSKIMSRSYYLSKIDNEKNRLKGQKDLSEVQRSEGLAKFKTALDTELRNKTASTSQ